MKKVLIICLTTLLALSSCGEYTALQKSTDYEYRYEAAKAYFVDGHYTRSATLLGDLIAYMKGTSSGEESLYLLAQSEYNRKDYETASSYFKKYYQSYPKGIYVEQARYYSALSLYNMTPDPRLDQTSTVDAMAEFQNFLDLYPHTSLREQTQDMLMKLQDKLVLKEYMAAKLYYDLGDYVGNSTPTSTGSNYEAAIVTAQNALKDYPYAEPIRREELSILMLRSKFHLARKSVEEKQIDRYRDAIDEYYAFANDFPESKYLKEAKKMYEQAEAIVKHKHIDLTKEE